VEPFAGYGFNKAHATCYAFVAYQTAYLKAHYPVEYMTALLATNVDNKDNVALYVAECRRLGIEVLPPDVNKSEVDFTVEGVAIRFGLGAIKNCGRAVVDAVILARQTGGEFKSLHEFCDRVQDAASVGKSMVECLIRAGTFSSVDENRGRLLAMLDEAMAHAAKAQRDKKSGQTGLFGDAPEAVQSPNLKAFEAVANIPRQELLAMEKDLLGLYISDHPLTHVRDWLENQVTVTSEQLQELDDERECVVGGIITTVRYHTTKRKNEQMAFVTIEDLFGKISVTVFPSVFKTCSEILSQDRIVIIKGKVSRRDRIGQDEDKPALAEVICESIKPLNDTEAATSGNGGRDTPTSAVHIRLKNTSSAHLELLKQVFHRHPGEAEVMLHVQSGDATKKKICTEIHVNVSDQFLSDVHELVGRGMVKAR